MLNILGHLCNEITGPHLERRNLLPEIIFPRYTIILLEHSLCKFRNSALFIIIVHSSRKQNPSASMSDHPREASLKKTIVEMTDSR